MEVVTCLQIPVAVVFLEKSWQNVLMLFRFKGLTLEGILGFMDHCFADFVPRILDFSCFVFIPMLILNLKAAMDTDFSSFCAETLYVFTFWYAF